MFDEIDEPSPVTVGVGDDRVAGRRRHRGARHRRRKRPVEQRCELVRLERFQNIHRGTRQQRADHLERRILGRGADERDEPALDEWKKRILLRLVEAMHLVDEKNRVPAGLRERRLGARNRVADVLDTGEDCRNGDEVRVECVGHQPRERSLPRSRRSPQDHRVRLARCECDSQRLAGPQQVALADDLLDSLRSQPLGKRRRGIGDRKQISRRRHRHLWAG